MVRLPSSISLHLDLKMDSGMEEELISVEATLHQCSIKWDSATLEEADCMVFRLEECRDCLTTLLNIFLAAAYSQSSNVLNAILELHSIVGQLLVMWENKLERLERAGHGAVGGRPRRCINTSLVIM